MQGNIRKILTDKTQEVTSSLFGDVVPTTLVSKVDNEIFGDYSTNVALILAKKLSQNPLDIANSIVASLNPFLKDVAVASVVKPGFVNFSLTEGRIMSNLSDITNLKDLFGENALGKGKNVSVEFVSANPTGPLHVGNTRGGPIGDVLANVLALSGYKVIREYYHNDLGVQVTKLGESILYHIKKEKGEKAELPEGGYEGDYVKEIAKEFVLGFDPKEGRTLKPEELGKMAVEYYLKDILEICQKIGIKFDKISKESQIATNATVNTLKEKNLLKQSDGALWFAPHDDLLQDRECVVIKSDGSYTYFANDIAYHLQKLNDKNDLLIDIWGANHFGHVPRMQASLSALGHKDKLKVILYQWVTLIRNGKEVSMSKRKGNFVTARELLDEVGSDALRWFFLDKDSQSHIKFDLDLAKKQSKENPVYYVQYAHARMCSVLAKVGENNENKENKENKENMIDGVDMWEALKKEERSLIRELIYFPDLVEDIARTYKVHDLTAYSLRLADRFHKFYEACIIIGSPQEKQRSEIVKASKQVLKNTLDLLGINAPEKM